MISLGFFDLMPGAVSVAGTSVGCAADGAICPASAFTPLAAAWATQGYWVQADIIHYLLNNEIGLWAPLLYVIAALTGMISVAIGMPPKTYVWFFLGPAFYSWLIGTTINVTGVEWRVSNYPQNQSLVWKLSEVGLLNSSIVARMAGDGEIVEISANKPPSHTVAVSNMFIWFDAVVSDTVQWMIRWTGVYSQLGNTYISGENSNVAFIGAPNAPGANFAIRDPGNVNQPWIHLTKTKWQLIDTITSAKLHTADLRVALSSFMSGACGDELSKWISPEALVAAQTAKSSNLADTVFLINKSSIGADVQYGDYYAAIDMLVKTRVPIPLELRNLIKVRMDGGKNEDITSFPSIYWASFAQKLVEDIHNSKDINCAKFLNLIVDGFRWEAGHIYYNLIQSQRPYVSPNELIYNLFYGWDIKGCGKSAVLSGGAPIDGAPCMGMPKTERLDMLQLQAYTRDLILMYLMRNEISTTKQLYDRRFGSGEFSELNAKAQVRTVGSKSKFGEIYTWATLLPYVQGVLLYLLAMAYPFACVMMVVPGWHKTLFTWMSFWAWVKLWDVGFAVVQVVERSVWAMMGNSDLAHAVSDKVMDLQYWATTSVDCGFYAGGADKDIDWTSGNFDCKIARVCRGICDASDSVGDYPSVLPNLRILDRAFVLTGPMDLDLTNAYYLYIMVALYLAVPTITGQLVLGAKSGAAGMVSNMIGGSSTEAGRAAGSAYTSDLATRLKANQSVIQQTAYANAMEKSGLATAALNSGNMDASKRMEAQAQGMRATGIGAWKEATNNAAARTAAGATAMKEGGDIGSKVFGGNNSLFGGLARTLGGLGSQTAGALTAYNNEVGRLGKINPLAAQGAEAQLRQGLASGEASGYAGQTPRLNAQADFDARMAAWSAGNNFAMHVAGSSAAAGVLPGSLSAGERPTNADGMAMNGMLGAEAEKAGNFFNPQANDGYFDGWAQRTEGMDGANGFGFSGFETKLAEYSSQVDTQTASATAAAIKNAGQISDNNGAKVVLSNEQIKALDGLSKGQGN